MGGESGPLLDEASTPWSLGYCTSPSLDRQTSLLPVITSGSPGLRPSQQIKNSRSRLWFSYFLISGQQQGGNFRCVPRWEDHRSNISCVSARARLEIGIVIWKSNHWHQAHIRRQHALVCVMRIRVDAKWPKQRVIQCSPKADLIICQNLCHSGTVLNSDGPGEIRANSIGSYIAVIPYIRTDVSLAYFI